ncbi:hypothetical protein ACFWVU_16315 [Streptomyces sp. NPDC058686]|uniref:hypothetical protein n=1 Tax=Streptomyces sp. NPDC058686 TaxID=3346599 RepID=UPI003658072B
MRSSARKTSPQSARRAHIRTALSGKLGASDWFPRATNLVERSTHGDLYRNDGKGNGSFTGRTKIATGWEVYKGVFQWPS